MYRFQLIPWRLFSTSFLHNLIRWQPPHNFGHLGIRVDPEPLVRRHGRQLHILGIQFLLHNLLERLEHERLCLV